MCFLNQNFTLHFHIQKQPLFPNPECPRGHTVSGEAEGPAACSRQGHAADVGSGGSGRGRFATIVSLPSGFSVPLSRKARPPFKVTGDINNKKRAVPGHSGLLPEAGSCVLPDVPTGSCSTHGSCVGPAGWAPLFLMGLSLVARVAPLNAEQLALRHSFEAAGRWFSSWI